VNGGPLLTTHANALLIREAGLLLRGPSGSGKSALTFALIARARAAGDFAALIADDRVAFENRGGRLLARPHPAIAGKMELRALGVVDVPCESQAVIRAVVDLAGSDSPAPERLPAADEDHVEICGVTLPRRQLALSDPIAVEKILFFLHALEAK
jgi:HPr kinase/phosphorylase